MREREREREGGEGRGGRERGGGKRQLSGLEPERCDQAGFSITSDGGRGFDPRGELSVFTSTTPTSHRLPVFVPTVGTPSGTPVCSPPPYAKLHSPVLERFQVSIFSLVYITEGKGGVPQSL